MELQGKRLVIYVDNIYQEMELWYPLYRFQEAGAEVVVAGAKAGTTYTSKLGYPATAPFLVVPNSSQPGGSDANLIYRAEGP